MKIFFRDLLHSIPTLYLFLNIFRPRLKGLKGGLLSVDDKYRRATDKATIAVDLGCGTNPANLFKAEISIGVDLFEEEAKSVMKCRLGYERLPFEDNSVDYLTAYDHLEQIPRYADLPEPGNTPFIFLMNECYRVLKENGIFLSSTPIFPYTATFQDPAHNNIMTAETLTLYFSDQKAHIAHHYGITTNFKVLHQRMLGQHLVAVLAK